MSESSVPELAVFLLEGQLTHTWDLFGKPVVLDLFPVGRREEITKQTSGLDMHAKQLSSDILTLVHALRSVGGYDFQGGSIEDKLRFIRGLHEPVYDLFIAELRAAQIKQSEDMAKRREDLKKSSPNRL